MPKPKDLPEPAGLKPKVSEDEHERQLKTFGDELWQVNHPSDKIEARLEGDDGARPWKDQPTESEVDDQLRKYLDDVTGPPGGDRPFFIHLEREIKGLLRLLQFKAMVEEGDDDNYIERLKRAFENVRRAAREAHNRLRQLRHVPESDAGGFTQPYLSTYIFHRADHLNRLDALARRCGSSTIRDALRIELEAGRRRAVLIAQGGLGPHVGPVVAGAVTLAISGILWWQFSTFPPLEALAGPVFLVPPILAVIVGMFARRKLDDQNVRQVRLRFSRALVASHSAPNTSAYDLPPKDSPSRFGKLAKWFQKKLLEEPRDLNEYRLPLHFWTDRFPEQRSNDLDDVAIALRPKISPTVWRTVKGVIRPVYANILPFAFAGLVSFVFIATGSAMLNPSPRQGSQADLGQSSVTAAACPKEKDAGLLDAVFNPQRCTTTVIGLDGRGDECVMAQGTIRWSGIDQLYIRPTEEADQRAGPIIIVPRNDIRRIEYATSPALPLCAETTSFALVGGQPWTLAMFLDPVINASSDPRAAFKAADKSLSSEFKDDPMFIKLAGALASCGTDTTPFAFDIMGFASDLPVPAADPDAHNHALAEGRRAYVLKMLKAAVVKDIRLAYRITIREGSSNHYVPIEHLKIPAAEDFPLTHGPIESLRFPSFADMVRERDKWMSDGDPIDERALEAKRTSEAFTRSVIIVPARGCRIVWRR